MKMKEKKPLIKQWYTLDQAIEKLNKENVCDLSRNDLVHFWLNDLIEFHTTIFYNIEKATLGNIKIEYENLQIFNFSPWILNSDEIEERFFNEKKRIFNNGILTVCAYTPFFERIVDHFDIYGTERERRETNRIDNAKKEISFEKRMPLLIEGLIRIDRPSSIIDKIKIKDSIKIGNISWLFIDDGDKDFIIELEKKTIDFLYLDEIYVTHENLQKLYDLYEEGKINNKLQSKKSQNTQARFIRDLLAINYNLHTAQEIRGALDNPRSMISRQFDEKELIKPSGKTIYNYINQVED
jgi:hypothetical protein